ncbi:MAG: hypothetical protein QME57_05055 [Patescibacteria group bacterium]|nr:hypothetical protein [Patescibacteria group bacterium]
MAKEIQKTLNKEEKGILLRELEKQGIQKWHERWIRHMALPEDIDPYTNDLELREKILRYLLLRILINQQARFEKVREISKSLAKEFNMKLITEPHNISEESLFKIFYKTAGEKGSELYRVGSLGGIKPVSLFAYRFKTFEGFIRWLKDNNLNLFHLFLKILEKQKVRGLFDYLNHHFILESGWVGNDPKACRMYANWVWFLLKEIWKEKIGAEAQNTLMLVDGHVGKVFCRAGLIDTIFYEKNRPYIIQASKMREEIENIVTRYNLAAFYVDNGTFYIFEDGFCLDINPHCKKCPISQWCKKYTKWTAYQKQKQ